MNSGTQIVSDASSSCFDPLPSGSPFCRVIPHFLTLEECRHYIELSERMGFQGADSDYPPSYRNNDRLVLDNPLLAEQMLRRLRPHVPSTIETNSEHEQVPWQLEALNDRFRFCRYRPGQRFELHQDGVYYRNTDCHSKLTFMIYLTDGDHFEGGDTLFYIAGPGDRQSPQSQTPIARVRPKAGTLIIFDHSLWHAGDTVTAGTKHIMRSDVLYRRAKGHGEQAAPSFERAHDGYIWSLALLADRRIASGGRDCSIHLWTPSGAYLGSLAGHDQSVLGIVALEDNRLASISRDRTLRIWNAKDNACSFKTTAHKGAALSITAMPNGTLATGGADGMLRLWDQTASQVASLSGHQGWIWDISPLGSQRLASASEDADIRIWDTRMGACLQVLRGKTPLRCIATSPDGSWLATGDIEGFIALWHASHDTWHLVHRLKAHDAAVRKLRLLSPEVLLSAGEDFQVRALRLQDLALISALPHQNFATDICPLEGGRFLSCGYDSRIQIQHHPLIKIPRKQTEAVSHD